MSQHLNILRLLRQSISIISTSKKCLLQWKRLARSILFFLQQGFQIGKGLVAGIWRLVFSRCHLTVGCRVFISRMFIFMAVDAQQFPVASIRRIVVVVVILVVDCEFAKLFPAKFASTPGADPGIQLERFFAVCFFPLLTFAPCLDNNPVLPPAI